MSIFKACDIRGKVGTELAPLMMTDLGRAMATILRRSQLSHAPPPSLIVAGDFRLSTPELKRAFILGARECGARLLDLGQVPTPVARFAFRELLPNALAIITASHNPADYNGLKLQFSPRPVTPEEIQCLKTLIARRDFDFAPGSLESVDVVPRYRHWILSHDPVQGLRVAVDAGNGAFSELAPDLLAALGFHVVPLFCQIDGRFPNRSPNSAIAENLTALRKQVVESHAHFGIAFDGDGDRVAFIDHRGRPVPYDKAVVLLATDVLSHEGASLPPEKRKIVYEINCSQAVPDELRRLGATPIIERAGHAFITARMIDEDALFGGEVSGHFFFRTLGGSDDGLYAAIRMGRILAEHAPSTLGALADSVPQYHPTPVQRIPLDPTSAKKIVEQIRRKAHRDGLPVLEIDGVRVQYDIGWGLARVSITEPVISLRFEAYRAEDLRTVIEQFLRPAPELRDEVFRRLHLQ